MRACRSKQKAAESQKSNSGGGTHHVGANNQEASEDTYSLFNMHRLGRKPFYLTLSVSGEQLQVELDTGTAVSVMSEQTYKTTWNAEKHLQYSQLTCNTYVHR